MNLLHRLFKQDIEILLQTSVRRAEESIKATGESDGNSHDRLRFLCCCIFNKLGLLHIDGDPLTALSWFRRATAYTQQFCRPFVEPLLNIVYCHLMSMESDPTAAPHGVCISEEFIDVCAAVLHTIRCVNAVPMDVAPVFNMRDGKSVPLTQTPFDVPETVYFHRGSAFRPIHWSPSAVSTTELGCLYKLHANLCESMDTGWCAFPMGSEKTHDAIVDDWVLLTTCAALKCGVASKKNFAVDMLQTDPSVSRMLSDIGGDSDGTIPDARVIRRLLLLSAAVLCSDSHVEQLGYVSICKLNITSTKYGRQNSPLFAYA